MDDEVEIIILGVQKMASLWYVSDFVTLSGNGSPAAIDYFISVLKTKRDLPLLLMFSAGKMSAALRGLVRFSPRPSEFWK